MKRISVGVSPAAEYNRYKRLLDALGTLFPVGFFPETAGGQKEVSEARLLLSGDRKAALVAAQNKIACYAVVSAPVSAQDSNSVDFSSSPALDNVLQGQSLPDLEKCSVAQVGCEAGDEVMAAKAGTVFWIHRKATDDSGAIDLVGIAPPVLETVDHLAQFYFRESFLRLLPLIHWLKRITAPLRRQPAPRRACLVFDDPTLPRPSYGCLNFAQLAAHAKEYNYHATIATVPLSNRRVSRENAELFRKNVHSLSLIIHGNDHVWHEMARLYPEPERIAILAQAWRRVAEMEKNHGFAVGRIMEAPYGIIDQSMITPLVRLGYEATLITPLQFLRHNQGGDFCSTIGLNGIEFLPGGLCLLPRIKMTPYWKTDALLAALLDQPIIIVGHHYDAIGNMDLMQQIATTLNQLNGLQWMNLLAIARSQYEANQEGSRFYVRLGSRRVVVPVPKGTNELVLERPWLTTENNEPLCVRSEVGDDEQKLVGGKVVEAAIAEGGCFEIVSPSIQSLDPDSVPSRRLQIWPLVRRLMMESRDRLYPYLHRAPAGGTAVQRLN